MKLPDVWDNMGREISGDIDEIGLEKWYMLKLGDTYMEFIILLSLSLK